MSSSTASNDDAPAILYREGGPLDLDEVISLYRRSTLGERRPVDDRAAMSDMMQHANLIITAWRGSELVGISRTLTDFSFVAYLSDLAVDAACQRSGIGKQLIVETRKRLKPSCRVVLLSAPAAVEYYPKIGFTHHPQAWMIPPGDPFPI